MMADKNTKWAFMEMSRGRPWYNFNAITQRMKRSTSYANISSKCWGSRFYEVRTMFRRRERKPTLSVVVVVYNMSREAPRTLHSLSADYQRHIDPDDYEVIVVDNGSNPPFDQKMVEGLYGNFRLIRIDAAPFSPAHAISRCLAEAK